MKAVAGVGAALAACRLVALPALLASALLLMVLLAVTERTPHAPVLAHRPKPATFSVTTEQPQEEAQEEAETQDRAAPVSCLDGAVVALPGGRLGNLAMEYATSWAMARRYGLRLAIAEEMRRALSAAFDGLSATPLSALLRQPPCDRHNLSEGQVLSNEWYQLPAPATPDEMVAWARRHHLPVVLRKYLLVPALAVAWLDELRKEFRFRPEVQRVADEKLMDATTQVAELAGCNRSQVCTVGVHVRRTDYGPYLRNMYPSWEEAGVEYYRDAAAEMVRALPARCAGVAFLVTSDDPRWCRKRLLPALRQDARERSPRSAVFLRSSKDAVDDLCLLASCEHSIISYGTFGTLAAMLAGGRVILYDMAQHGASHRNPSFRIADYLPQWNTLS